MKVGKGRALIYLLALIFTQSSYSQSEFRPAKFRDFDKIHTKIAFPRKGRDVNRIFPCKLFLPLNGRIKDVYCARKENDRDDWLYKRAIYNALINARMDRAMVNGKARTVILSFMVAFIREGSDETIEIYLNHATEFEKHGLNYTAPQLIIPLNRRAKAACRRNYGRLGVITVVDIAGLAQTVKITGSDGTPQCKRSLLERFKNALYIPAHSNGVPVKAMYYQPTIFRFEGRRIISANSIGSRL